MPKPLKLRVVSPPGGSMWMTSAPRSARIMAADGPMTACVKASTLIPCRGSGRFEGFMVVLSSVSFCA